MLNREMRRHGVTGTDIVALCGLSDKHTPYTIWLDKMGLLPERDADPVMEEGKHFEPVIASIYEARTGERLYEVDTLCHSVQTWMMGSPDRLMIGKRKGVEIKNVFWNQKEWQEEVPLKHRIQCAWYQEVLDYDEWDLAANLSRPPVRIFEIPRDRELGALLIETGERFYRDHMLTERPPPIDGTRTAQDYLQRRFASPNETMVVATEQDRQDYERLQDIERSLDPLEAEAETIRNRIRERIGSARGLEGDDFYFLWSKSKDRVITQWEAVARFFTPPPLLIELHTTTKPGMRSLTHHAKKRIP